MEKDLELEHSAYSKLDVIYGLLKNMKSTGTDESRQYKFSVTGKNYLYDYGDGSGAAARDYVLYLDSDLHLILKDLQSSKTWDTAGSDQQTHNQNFYNFVLENIPTRWIFDRWNEMFPIESE